MPEYYVYYELNGVGRNEVYEGRITVGEIRAELKRKGATSIDISKKRKSVGDILAEKRTKQCKHRYVQSWQGLVCAKCGKPLHGKKREPELGAETQRKLDTISRQLGIEV